MVKAFDKDYTLDQGLNMVNGTAGLAAGGAMLFAPKFVHKQANVGSGNETLTRFGGTCLLVAAAHSTLTALNENNRQNKTQLKVTAVHSAMVSGVALHQLTAGKSKKDSFKLIAGVAGANAVVSAVRGFRRTSGF